MTKKYNTEFCKKVQQIPEIVFGNVSFCLDQWRFSKSHYRGFDSCPQRNMESSSQDGLSCFLAFYNTHKIIMEKCIDCGVHYRGKYSQNTIF